MRFWILFSALLFSVLYFRFSEPPQYPLRAVSDLDKNRNDSLMRIVEYRCDLICSAEMRGKNGYVVLERPTYVSFLVLEEDLPYVRTFAVEEYRNGRWMPIFTGEKQHNVEVISIGKILEGRIRLNVIRAYKIPHIKRVALYAERIYEYE